MAKPDCDDGWLKYAHELDAALAVADFTKGARIVLRETFAQVFGPAKRKAAQLCATDIAERSGSKRPYISRAIKELVDSRVLMPLEDGSFRFLKDYESWLMADGRTAPDGTLRLSREMVRYCRKATAHAMSFKYTTDDEDGNQPVTLQPSEGNQPVTETGNQPVTARQVSCNQMDTKTYPTGYAAEAAPPDPPHRNGRAEFKTGDFNSHTYTPRAGVSVSINGSEPEPFESPNPNPLAASTNPCLLTPAERKEVKAAAELAERLLPMREIGPMLSRQPRPIDGMDVSWWSPAIRRLAERSERQWSWHYLLGILKGYAAHGGPELERRPVAGTIAASPAAPAETPEQKQARIDKATVAMKARIAERDRQMGGRHGSR